jgi:hypothetical protein
VADVDAALVQKIFNIAKRKRETNVHHHGQTNDLWACLEITKGGTFCHPATLIARPTRLKKFPLTVPASILEMNAESFRQRAAASNKRAQAETPPTTITDNQNEGDT